VQPESGEDNSLRAPRWLRDQRIDLTDADQFDVLPLVKKLVELLIEAPTPFTLSLSGAWVSASPP
jgi:hypothetical protein